MRTKILNLPGGEFSSRGFKVVRTPYFSVRMKKNGGEHPRIGAVAGKAVSKTAVGRNFLKRQARSSLASIIKPGNDLLILFSPAVRQLTQKKLRDELREAAKKAQL